MRIIERHVDLCVLAFMFLEEMRRDEAARTRSPVKRREVLISRTSGMLRRLRREALAEGMSYGMELKKLKELKKGAAEAKDLLP